MPGSGRDHRYPFLRPRPAALTSLAAQLAEIEASGVYTNFGPKNRLLEDRLTERLFGGVGACVTCVNATTALMLAIRHEMAPQRRFALLPSFTFPASALAAVWNGLTPLFCDIDARTWLPAERSEVALLDGYRDEIAVMIPQATFGNCLDLDRYVDLARFYDVPVVVDAAPAIGSQDVDGRQFGTSSPFPVVFSMHATKTFATDEGGFVYADRPGLVEDLRSMTNFGFGAARETTMAGLNGKLSELGALLALVKLDEID
ncbi:MAG: DegT/DnrJ/EryC1/StrS family aminotransferase, partial [Actinobacteria bacterium]|nr:DegT/DnrJ/EryC1/StrS family aminotransferase [Actinomycetota bacterium]